MQRTLLDVWRKGSSSRVEQEEKRDTDTFIPNRRRGRKRLVPGQSQLLSFFGGAPQGRETLAGEKTSSPPMMVVVEEEEDEDEDEEEEEEVVVREVVRATTARQRALRAVRRRREREEDVPVMVSRDDDDAAAAAVVNMEEDGEQEEEEAACCQLFRELQLRRRGGGMLDRRHAVQRVLSGERTVSWGPESPQKIETAVMQKTEYFAQSGRWVDPATRRVPLYTLATNGYQLVGGGSGGQLKVFNVDPAQEDACCDGESPDCELGLPYLSFQAHFRWISECAFLSQHPTQLLTASDDGSVCMWRIPNPGPFLAEVEELHPVRTAFHLHSAGIYSLHEVQGQVMTSSKDSSVTLSLVGEHGLDKVRSLEDVHKGVVKCVRMDEAQPHLFATCGNDRCIRAGDLRAPDPFTHQLPDAHDLAINSVSWSPRANVVMSSSFDRTIKLWDLRAPSQELLRIQSHYPKSMKGRANSIHHPLFCLDGLGILTSADNSKNLFLFDARTGDLCCVTDLGAQPQAMCWDPRFDADRLFTSHAGHTVASLRLRFQ